MNMNYDHGLCLQFFSEDEELRREREQHVKAWVCSQYTKNETAQESRITPIERFRAVANTIMIGNFFGT